MRESDHDFFDGTIRDSLRTIKATQIRLHLLEGTCATRALVATQIELHDRLLNALTAIHRSLADHFEPAREMPPTLSRASLNA